ncbi:helix-turn-helix domain-containing protein [Lederbergia graminis]|uniref:Helix-turn-helix domain-containing protein n=1 Tax=Lederbergia graminis TaxID=735518 RepID=A0ABW0LIV9_9BACI
MKWDRSFIDGAILLNQNTTHIHGNDASISIHYWGAKQQHYNNKPHQHSFFELCYIVNGVGTYIDDGKEFPLKKDVLFLSRPYIKHQILSQTGLDIIFVGFEINKKETADHINELFTSLESSEKFYTATASELPIVKLWTSLLTLMNQPFLTFNDSLQGLGSAFFFSILEHFNDQRTPIKKKKLTSSFLIYQAKLYINDNIHRALKLDDVADYIFISGRHLSRIFKAELGQTFSSYVRKERVRKAGNLLTGTDLTNEEIAKMTGFDNVHYFSSVFSSEMGLPPGEFREKFRKNVGEGVTMNEFIQ